MSSRAFRLFFAKWKYLIFACCVTYLFVLYVPLKNTPRSIESNRKVSVNLDEFTEDVFKFNPVDQEPFDVVGILTNSPIKLKERMKANVKRGQKRLILSWNAGHSAENLQGCPEWKCEYTRDRNKASEADVVIFSSIDPSFKRNPNQYVVYFSQESPVHASPNIANTPDIFNMTLGFRHDTPGGSPYGYTVKLGEKSRITEGKIVDENLVSKKSKGAAWYVSHCSTSSRREVFIKKLQKYFQVDIYGSCGPLKCPRNGECEKMLDIDYHFYVAFENSICKDYVTEKLWRQGYQKTIIPLVMKRSLVEPFVPPNSFIAADDFKTVKGMGDYLKYLMSNKTAYMEYFNWRRDYKVVFLDGKNHDILEKPWGFCQLCRMAWTDPREHQTIPNWRAYWDQTCDRDGQLVNSILDP